VPTAALSTSEGCAGGKAAPTAGSVGWRRGGLCRRPDILPSAQDLAVGISYHPRTLISVANKKVLAANEPSLQQRHVFKNLILWTPRSHASRRYLLFISVLVQSIGEIITIEMNRIFLLHEATTSIGG
jgi:hypothetical protein